MWSFIAMFAIFFSFASYYARRDGNLVQPHAYYTANQFVLLLLIPFVQFYAFGLIYDKEGMVFLNAMICLSYISFSIGFFSKKDKGVRALDRIIGRFDIKGVGRSVLSLHVLAMLLLAMLFFVLLAQKSGFGVLNWLQDPRAGYQHYRRGLGFLYVIANAILNFAYLYILFFRVRSGKGLMAVTLAFLFIFYFFGSKATIVFTAFESIVFYSFFIRKIRFNHAASIFIAISILFMAVFSLYSGGESADPLYIDVLNYAGYYNEGRRFFADFDTEFGFAYGKEYLNGLWMYVPRALYPEKPYSYGIVDYVVDRYYPDAGERGDTPSFGGPVEEYLNFGVIGVVIAGLLRGYFSSLFYLYFLRHGNFIGFVLLSNEMGYSIFPTMEWPAYKALWYALNILLLAFHRQIIKGATATRQGRALDSYSNA